jgi:hypothetical protein
MIDRTTIIRGPAVAQFGGATIFTQGDIEDNFGITTWQPDSAAHGKLDERIDMRNATVSLTPVGAWDLTALGLLIPYRTTLIGASLFGADVPLVVKTVAGQKHTYYATAITGMPELRFGSKQTLLGQATWTCIGKNNTAWTTADSFRKVEAEAFGDPTWATFDPDDVITEPPVISWDTPTTATSFETVDGVNVSFSLETDNVETDEDGVVDMTLGDVGVLVRFRPLGQTEAEIQNLLGLQGAGAYTRGAKLLSKGYDLSLTHSLGSLTVHNAALVTAGFRFGRTTLRHGEVGFVAARKFTGGKRDPLWTFA